MYNQRLWTKPQLVIRTKVHNTGQDYLVVLPLRSSFCMSNALERALRDCKNNNNTTITFVEMNQVASETSRNPRGLKQEMTNEVCYPTRPPPSSSSSSPGLTPMSSIPSWSETAETCTNQGQESVHKNTRLSLIPRFSNLETKTGHPIQV